MIKTPERAGAVGTPAVGDILFYADADGVLRAKRSDGSDFRVGAGISPELIPTGMHLLIPTNHQLINFGGVTIDGSLTVDGNLVIL